VKTSRGSIKIPEITLDGRQSKIIVTDYKLNADYTLLYSSAEVLTYGIFHRPIIFLYLNEGQRGEFAFKGSSPTRFVAHGLNQDVEVSAGSVERMAWTQKKGYTILDFSTAKNQSGSSPLVYLLDKPSAWSFFAASTTKDPQVRPEQQLFILGPYLVRNATVVADTLYIIGDHDIAAEPAKLEAYVGDPLVQSINWNGRALLTKSTPHGALQAEVPHTRSRVIKLPSLDQADWRVADSFPEMAMDYNDSKWTVCNNMTTKSPVKPLSMPVLFSSDYGFYTGIKIYRGSFSSKAASRANITVAGGEAFGWNAWLNGQFIGGNVGEPGGKGPKRVAAVSSTSSMLDFGTVALRDGKNTLTILCDYHGHDQTSVRPGGGRNPRGILGAKLYAQNSQEVKFDEWRIMGNAGAGPGKSNNIDPVRGPMNEGGLYGERMGWHLPGYNTSEWERESPLKGMPTAGVKWYTTRFELNIPQGLDVPIAIELRAAKDVLARIQLFINGYVPVSLQVSLV
jgi:hypothetical protein